MTPIQSAHFARLAWASSLGRLRDDYFSTRDHLGSIREVVASDGTTVASRVSYDPWGQTTESGAGALTDFGFTGHYLDRPSGLNFPLYRGYSPSLGRWLSRDPIGLRGGFNLYGYVLNDPVDLIDPEGKFFFLAFPAVYWMAAGGVAIVGTAYATGLLENPFPPLLKAGQSVWDSLSQMAGRAYPGNDGTVAPGPDWVWKGNGEVGSKAGNWYNEQTDESLHPDLGHAPPIGPHWDWKDPNGDWWRLYEDGRCEPRE